MEGEARRVPSSPLSPSLLPRRSLTEAVEFKEREGRREGERGVQYWRGEREVAHSPSAAKICAAFDTERAADLAHRGPESEPTERE